MLGRTRVVVWIRYAAIFSQSSVPMCSVWYSACVTHYLHSPLTLVPSEEDAAERWRQWRLRNVAASRTDAKRARIAFILIFAGLGVWLGQGLYRSFWP